MSQHMSLSHQSVLVDEKSKCKRKKEKRRAVISCQFITIFVGFLGILPELRWTIYWNQVGSARFFSGTHSRLFYNLKKNNQILVRFKS